MSRTYKILFLLLIMVLIVVDLTAGTTTVTVRKVPIPKLSYIVRLVDNTGVTFCTGTVISDSVIITAAHCVLESSPFGMSTLSLAPINIRPDDNINRNVYATATGANQRLDYAVLKGDFRRFNHAHYVTDVMKLMTFAVPGQGFKSCGFPLNGNLYCNTMHFQSVLVFQWMARGVLLPGMSGGPVFVTDLINGDTLVAVNTVMRDDKAIISPIYNIVPEGLK